MALEKRRILKIFEDPRSPHFGVINDTLALATIISIFAIILETVPSLNKYSSIFLTIEWVTVTLFSVEYALRLWATPKRGDYAFSFFGIVDLISILPTFIGLGNLTFLKSARIVRIIRFLRLVRLTKLSRLHVKDAEETLGIVGFNILLYAFALLFALLILGVLTHVVISSENEYWSIPGGMFWSLKVILGGIPAPVPAGTGGILLFVLTKFVGMALFGLLIGVVGKLFNQWILGKK